MLLSLEQIAGRCRLKVAEQPVFYREEMQARDSPKTGESLGRSCRKTRSQMGDEEPARHSYAQLFSLPRKDSCRFIYSMAKMARTVTPFSMRRGLIERGSEALASLCMAIIGMGRVVLVSLSFEA